MTVVLEVFAEPIIRMFLSDTEADVAMALSVGAEYIRVVGACLIVFTAYMLVKATFKGSGDMSWFILTTLLSFFIRLVITVGFAGRFGVDVIWCFALCAGWLEKESISAS